ncbi:MAG: putative lipid II flippase FtsW [Oscillospiraceae bacterium]|jgi:cell division protein FtsW|nr:putative lipid II flippase FtsW [Oscillospiraceae bacterium]
MASDAIALRRGRQREAPLPLRRKLLAYGGFDFPFMLIVTVLLCVGLVMMFSASYVYAMRHYGGDAYHFIKRQLIFAVAGFVLMLAISKINLDILRKLAIPGLVTAFVLLGVVLVYHTNRGDFKRWIPIVGDLTIQPSELAKVALILFFAYGMERWQRPKYNPRAKQGTAWGRAGRQWGHTALYMAVLLLMVGLIFMENHVSGTIITLGIGGLLIFIGEQRIPLWFYAIVAAVGVGAVMFVLSKPEILPEHAAKRIVAFLNPESDPSGDNWQTIQSLYAVGSGGWFGKGFGQSVQKHLYLPEPMNDFVFAIVCEELGFFGAFVIVLLFIALIWRGFMIALHTKERFGTLLVIGIVLQIGLQVALNIGVVTAVLPNTGIPLPFFSYGGTALLILLAEMGIVLAVSRVSREIKR